jgi:hypothetical protein
VLAISVVLAKEYHRQLPNRREIHCFMEGADI